MEKELLLLRKLYTNPELTQRDMAKATGISLGAINALIKELVKRDVIRVEKIRQKARLYHLTSQALKQKAESTYKYIVEAYVFLEDLRKKIDELLNNIERENVTIVLFGNRDKIFELIEAKLIENGRTFKLLYSFEEIKDFIDLYEVLIIVWQPENINLVKSVSCNYFDLLGSI